MRRFAHRLALQLGCTVGELSQRMSWDEFQWWCAYDRIEPLPDPWLQTGQLAAAIVNSNPFRGKHARPARPVDFLPVAPSLRPRTWRDVHASLALIRKPPTDSCDGGESPERRQ